MLWEFPWMRLCWGTSPSWRLHEAMSGYVSHVKDAIIESAKTQSQLLARRADAARATRFVPDGAGGHDPEEHPVRLVDEILDQLDWSEWEASYHGSIGKPPIHPAVMAKILLFAMIRRR